MANRVQQIRNHTEVDQWNDIESKNNPADLASSGSRARDIISNEL